MVKIVSYEGWYAVYEHGCKLLETDNLKDILEDLVPEISWDADIAYDWHDNPDIGCFPEVLPNA